MKKIIASLFVALSALIIVPSAVASAGTDICDGHMNQKDAGFGYASSGTDPVYVPACSEGKSGPDTQNNAQTPNVSGAPTGQNGPVYSSTGSYQGDEGSFDETQGIPDEDGIQGHDNVKDGNLFVPGGVS